jgi:hypothetical protein
VLYLLFYRPLLWTEEVDCVRRGSALCLANSIVVIIVAVAMLGTIDRAVAA